MLFRSNLHLKGKDGPGGFGFINRKKTAVKGTAGPSVFKVIRTDDDMISPNKPDLLTTENDDLAALTGMRNEPKLTEKFTNLFDSVDNGGIGGIEEGRKTKYEFQRLQIIDISVTLTAIIGGLITIVTYDLQYYEADSSLLSKLLWVSFWSTKLTIALDIMRYLQKLKYLKARRLMSRHENLYSSGEIWPLLVEIILLLLQPYPFITNIKVDGDNVTNGDNFFYYVNDIFSVLIAVRIYLVGRVILNTTLYRSPRARRLSTLYGADNDYLFAYKCLMKKSPFLCVVILLGGSILLFGYMLRICEKPLNRDTIGLMTPDTYWNAMWCIILTMTTVGYGDYYPRTHYGRIVTFLCCIWGVFVVSLMVVTLTNTLSMSSAEERALTVLERLELRQTLREDAANVLTNMTKIGLNNKKRRRGAKSDLIQAENNKIIKSIKMKLHEFKHHSRQLKSMSDDGNISEEMARQFEFMRDEIKEIKAQQQNVSKVVQQLAEMLETKIVESITKVPDFDSPIPRKMPQ